MCSSVSETPFAGRNVIGGEAVLRDSRNMVLHVSRRDSTSNRKEGVVSQLAVCSQCMTQILNPLVKVQRFLTVYEFCSMQCYAKHVAMEL